jgi:cytochrome c oxidase cbb3-type subunit 2
MPYKLSPHVPLVVAKDAAGKLHHHYQGGGFGANSGAIIPWLNDEQRQHFLRHKLVEEIAGSQPPVVEAHRPEAPDSGAVPELIDECIRQLDEADVPTDAGAPTCRTVLREKGISFSNDTIAQAVRKRKSRAS